jgi:hypothetical protein
MTSTVGYVPDGMTKEQYQKMLQKDKEATKGKNLGAYGPQSFKSRSLQAFQKDLEEGKAAHLMPVLNAKELLKKGKIKQEDIPYMQVSRAPRRVSLRLCSSKAHQISWLCYTHKFLLSCSNRSALDLGTTVT